MRYALNSCQRTRTPRGWAYKGVCTVTGKNYTVEVHRDELAAYSQGQLIQDAMPRLSSADREFLQSGISPEGWHQMFFPGQVLALAQRNYEAGGDMIVEGFTDKEILETFKTLDDVKQYCLLKREQATNCRWGEDNDPEINRPDWVDLDM